MIKFIAGRALFAMGNMTTRRFSASYAAQNHGNSSNFSSSSSKFRNFCKAFSLPRSSSDQIRPHYRIDYTEPDLGLGILINSLIDETKPFPGLFPAPLKSTNIVLRPQVKMTTTNIPPSPGNSSPGTFPATRSNRLTPPLGGGDDAIYNEIQESSPPDHATDCGGGWQLVGSSAMKSILIPRSTGAIHASQDQGSSTPTLISDLPSFPEFIPNFLDFLEKRRHQRENSSNSSTSHPFSDQFLRICYACKRKLNVKEDIYIYRGDSSFCSEECRFEYILVEGLEKTLEDKPPNPKSSPTTPKNGVIFFLASLFITK
ncbi:hypothetical protein U1Q18_006633 [Sarracenia purpurea var. burkii]